MIEKYDLHIKPLGDSALVVQFGKDVSEETHEKVMNFIQAIESNPFKGFLEAVPTYNTVTVFYNPLLVFHSYPKQHSVFETVYERVQNYATQHGEYVKEASNIVEIPVLYGGEFGPDLDLIAHRNQLRTEEVIQIHSERDYLVYMIGFAPGFPYVGGMDERIEAPRKENPRKSIPAGSVGIAGKQTGIYPFESPGGWQIIGRTPAELFLPERNPPTLIQPGDRLRFVPIDAEEYMKQLGGRKDDDQN